METQGQLQLSAPQEILTEIILPIVRFANRVGGVGKGWRRPLHQFVMNNGREAARGCHLELTHQVKPKDKEKSEDRPFVVNLKPEDWDNIYHKWRSAVKTHWPNRYLEKIESIEAEIFSPTTCAVYLVNGCNENPIDSRELAWKNLKPIDTRGDGMELIYKPKYKRKIDVGGNAGGGGAYCSWVSIKRINRKEGTQEVVCIFMGDGRKLRTDFLSDLSRQDNAIHLFGRTPDLTR